MIDRARDFGRRWAARRLTLWTSVKRRSVPRSRGPHAPRVGFTLVELLVTISIITLLASMVLVALTGVQESSRRDRTEGQVARIDALISEKWESFRSRRVPVTVMTNDPRQVARERVDGLRQMMRMEMPDRKADLLYGAPQNSPSSALWLAYRRKIASLLAYKIPAITTMDFHDDHSMALSQFEDAVNRQWTDDFQAAECLYLILSQMVDQDSTALEFFRDQEIGDKDADGMPEILDGWGNPIFFVRWAPGFRIPGSPQDGESPDPFDFTVVYQQMGMPSFALYPLISSAGPDGLQGFFHSDVNNPLIYATTMPPNNPFVNMPYPGGNPTKPPVGSTLDTNANGVDDEILDNITNHNLTGT